MRYADIIIEKAPPGKKAKRFIRKSQEDFKKRYGEAWKTVLYATAWKMFGESVEDTGNVIYLYRGDASKIDYFKLTKADAGALLGRGIYLTDNKEVAADYVQKGNDRIVYPRTRRRGRDDEAMSPEQLTSFYFESIILYELKYSEELDNLKEHYRSLFWQQRQDEEDSKVRSERINKEYKAALGKLKSKLLAKAKALYAARRPNLRIMKTTLGQYRFVTADQDGVVAEFAVPRAYADKCLHAEQPMPPEVIEAMRKAVVRAGHDPTQIADFRLLVPHRKGQNDGRYATDEENVSFDDYIEGFKTRGARYAWTDTVYGGDGKAPSFDAILNGTHMGFNLFYGEKLDPFIDDLQAMGYVGFEYQGGVRLAGTGARGGGGHLHRAFSFWDEATVNGFRAGEHQPDALEVDPALGKGIRAKSLDLNVPDD